MYKEIDVTISGTRIWCYDITLTPTREISDNIRDECNEYKESTILNNGGSYESNVYCFK